jgi:hypothetical protein
MSSRLRFAEKNIDKFVINIFNKYVDSVPGKIQAHWLDCGQDAPDIGMSDWKAQQKESKGPGLGVRAFSN